MGTSWAAGPAIEALGQLTGIEGNVILARVTRGKPTWLTLDEEVRVSDVIETQPQSRVKILFADDTLLTVGETSRVTITEFQYDQSHGFRRMVLSVDRGTVRILVGRRFARADAHVELRTPAAVLTARSAYFIVWVQEATGTSVPTVTGIANIGERGQVSMTSGHQLVRLDPGQFATASSQKPQGVPTPILQAPSLLKATMAATELKGSPKPESPKQILRILEDYRSIPGIPGPLTPSERPRSTVRLPAVPETPPAVISGAIAASLLAPPSRAGAGATPLLPSTAAAPTPSPPASTSVPAQPAPFPIATTEPTVTSLPITAAPTSTIMPIPAQPATQPTGTMSPIGTAPTIPFVITVPSIPIPQIPSTSGSPIAPKTTQKPMPPLR